MIVGGESSWTDLSLYTGVHYSCEEGHSAEGKYLPIYTCLKIGHRQIIFKLIFKYLSKLKLKINCFKIINKT